MNPAELKSEIKSLIVSELNLQGRDPATIADDAPLFHDPHDPKNASAGGLGLDSLDALQLAISIEEKFGVRIPEGDEARPIFRSVSALAEYVGAASNGAGGDERARAEATNGKVRV